jgi:prophage regulatory protein
MRFLRIDEVMTRVGLSRPTIWRLERANEFPSRRQLGRNSVGWLEDEIEEWIRSREVVENTPGRQIQN